MVVLDAPRMASRAMRWLCTVTVLQVVLADDEGNTTTTITTTSATTFQSPTPAPALAPGQGPSEDHDCYDPTWKDLGCWVFDYVNHPAVGPDFVRQCLDEFDKYYYCVADSRVDDGDDDWNAELIIYRERLV